jgi:hypothetical protein
VCVCVCVCVYACLCVCVGERGRKEERERERISKVVHSLGHSGNSIAIPFPVLNTCDCQGLSNFVQFDSFL